MNPPSNTHQWTWTGQSERHAFGDPSKPYAVDHWRCSGCEKQTTTRGTSNPPTGPCRTRAIPRIPRQMP